MKKEEIAYNRGYYVNEEGILYNPKGKEIGNKVYQPYRFTNIRIDITNFEDTKEYDLDNVFDNDNMKYCDYYSARILKHNLNTKEDIIMIEW